MSVLFVVLPLATLLSAAAAIAYLWATRSGQFDDLATPAVRLLCDELRERGPGPRGETEQGLRQTTPSPPT